MIMGHNEIILERVDRQFMTSVDEELDSNN